MSYRNLIIVRGNDHFFRLDGLVSRLRYYRFPDDYGYHGCVGDKFYNCKLKFSSRPLVQTSLTIHEEIDRLRNELRHLPSRRVIWPYADIKNPMVQVGVTTKARNTCRGYGMAVTSKVHSRWDGPWKHYNRRLGYVSWRRNKKLASHILHKIFAARPRRRPR